jgi:hypothetical protein
MEEPDASGMFSSAFLIWAHARNADAGAGIALQHSASHCRNPWRNGLAMRLEPKDATQRTPTPTTCTAIRARCVASIADLGNGRGAGCGRAAAQFLACALLVTEATRNAPREALIFRLVIRVKLEHGYVTLEL